MQVIPYLFNPQTRIGVSICRTALGEALVKWQVCPGHREVLRRVVLRTQPDHCMSAHVANGHHAGLQVEGIDTESWA